jgi:hypothetical protein
MASLLRRFGERRLRHEFSERDPGLRLVRDLTGRVQEGLSVTIGR